MLIRSQDKCYLLNFNGCLYLGGSEKTYDVVHNDGRKTIWLGEYTTKEKAIKVIDEIQRKYDKAMGRSYTQTGGEFIYEMPKDEMLK